MPKYKTIKNESFDEYVVKRSRFIGYAKPVDSQDDAVDFINSIKTKHWDARHNVYAYVLRDGQTRRYSDDGEPQGTAGVPVLDVLLKEELTDCVVVVTRYFGGIMLGAGGLVRAYSHSAKIAVDASEIITMSLCVNARLICDYTFYGRVLSLIAEFNGICDKTEFLEDVVVDFKISKDIFNEFEKQLVDLSCGKYKSIVLSEEYAQIK
ncbi:MAG: YigZ family protein [Acutalibacteraceae bacterium]|nr:YigZ family protein [Clostridiales bacterium]